ncbi:putative mitochondrial protein AtMg00860 [Silene latifolia]|uniref:putative mitochondrial protein AtMg00860 n=1 Tax=Silene latifolia TaxID=37657 RepID=UPI003D7706FC
MGPKELEEFKKQLEELLDKGYVGQMCHLGEHLWFFIKKKNGSMRLCIDYMELNNVTIKNREEYEKHLSIMLQTMRENNLYAKLSKCEFLLEKVMFLGHVVSKDGVSVDPTKIEAVSKWERPKNVGDIRSFLGLAGYYMRFIKDFSKIAKSLTTLMRKENRFKWDEICEKAFITLKERLTRAPILTLPEGSENFEVYTDTSKNGLGYERM